MSPRIGSKVHRLRRRVLLHRRGLAALFLAGAVLAGLNHVRPVDQDTVRVQVARHDLVPGSTLLAGDLTTRRVPASLAPDPVAKQHLLGRTVAAPVAAGEPVSELRLTGPGLAARYPGQTVVPVRLSDPAVARLLRVGDPITVITAGHSDPAQVVSIPPIPDDSSDLASSGVPVLMALKPDAATRLAMAGVSEFVTVAFTG